MASRRVKFRFSRPHSFNTTAIASSLPSGLPSSLSVPVYCLLIMKLTSRGFTSSLRIPLQPLAQPLRIPRLQPQLPVQRRVQAQPPQRQQKNTFFSLPELPSFLPSDKTRTLTASRTLPYPPAPLFKVIASVDAYADFLPFLNESTVTARDPETDYPTRAFLTIGYGPLAETFTSRVDCDPVGLTVEARSGDRFGVDSKMGQQAGAGAAAGGKEGIFEYLSTRWELVPDSSQKTTDVRLQIQFEFRSQFHAAVMSTVEGQMAGVMVEAFEKRMHECQ